ncbi:hypothetical protein PG999_008013 [Apiospora kogelbergensis]|uniref:Uncharacterized protein n=1 Tax=Apiospora kogelbergensis TaxID=1337665 RepID=A0AAW0QUT6_9PEZI
MASATAWGLIMERLKGVTGTSASMSARKMVPLTAGSPDDEGRVAVNVVQRRVCRGELRGRRRHVAGCL